MSASAQYANFAEMHVNAVQKHMHNIALQEEERLDSGGSGEADDSEEGSADF